MQLRVPRCAWAAVVAVAWLVITWAWPSAAYAGEDDEVRAAVTYFQEPAPDTSLIVVHPQVGYRQDYTSHFGLDAGYDADVVTGATPQIFGIDAVSSATSFNEVRHHGALGLRFLTDYATLRVAGGFAGESDYRSGTVSAQLSTELFNRNTQVSGEYTHNFDSVCDANNADTEELLELRALDNSDNCFRSSDETATRKLAIDTAQIAVTQVVTPWMLLQAGTTGQILRGFQANPYRQVLLGQRAVQEHLPDVRNRLSLFARTKFALRPIRGSVEAGVRGYFDSWAVEGFTADLAWDQYVARPLILRARARWHVQDSALFYRDGNDYASGGAVGSYWTGDRELSALLNQTYGVKATFLLRPKNGQLLKIMDDVRISAKADMLMYRSLTDTPTQSPNFDRTRGLVDGIVVSAQAGFAF